MLETSLYFVMKKEENNMILQVDVQLYEVHSLIYLFGSNPITVQPWTLAKRRFGVDLIYNLLTIFISSQNMLIINKKIRDRVSTARGEHCWYYCIV